MENVHLHPMVRILQCTVQPLTARWDHDNYAAPYWRLYWNPTPGARVELGADRIALQPDRCVVIPPDTPYRARCEGVAEHLYIHFLAQGRYRTARPGLYAFDASATVLAVAAEIRAGQADAVRQQLLALTLAHLALWQVPATAFPAEPADPRVRQIRQYIDEHCAQPLTNPALAARAGMNTNAFIRLFREASGETPQAYLRRRRIDAACVALHGGDASIDAIAADTGFCDRFHFTKVFKQLRGQTPAAFRQTRQG